VRRIALLSDIHGNLSALDAVLADIDASGTEERFCLGDLVGYGPDPVAVIDRIRTLGIPTVVGNYDYGVGARKGECGCYYATAQALADGEASYDFTTRAVDEPRAEWLATLPRELHLNEGGLRVLLTHGSPRRINEYLLPARTDKLLARLADEAEADVVCVGHVHIPYHRVLSGGDGRAVHYVSAGSVGKPKDGDPRACWVELVLGGPDNLVDAIIHRVDYDVEATAAGMRLRGLPETLIEALRTA
jgi:predicted phosphodiesterase